MQTGSKKRPRITAGEESAKPRLKMKKKEFPEKKKSKLAETERDLYKATEEKKKNNISRRKRRGKEKGSKPEATEVYQYNNGSKDESNQEKKRGKFFRKEKRKEVARSKVDVYNEADSVFDEQTGAPADKENNERKLRKKKIKREKKKKAGIDKVDELHDEQNGAPADKENNGRKLRKKKIKQEKKKKAGIDKVDELHDEVEDVFREENGKSKKARQTKKEHRSSKKEGKTQENREETEQNEVYEISSGDEDCSRGMKKWITEYHRSRPGLEILQERIDDFIAAYEAQEEQAIKEREALAAEGGWTVVVHHKGRKKTTDTESGITVGSVAQAAVLENMAKKKSKDVGLDFYRFQKREAQRNEIMALQSKFEQDKKRIQQLRAARKFRPY